jgi:hypothetical protein
VLGDPGQISCSVLLVLNEPRKIHYCDLAITSRDKHVEEPWSIDAVKASDWERRYDDGVDGLTVIRPRVV